MPANDARPIPRKNAAFRVYFGFRDNTGAPITGGITGADTEISIDGAAFADAAAEFTEIGTTGRGFVDLIAAEMNGDAIYLKASCTNANSRDVDIVLYPEENGDVRVNVTAFNGADLNGNGPIPDLGILDQGTAQAATATTVQLRAAAAFADNTLIGATIGVFGSTQGYWQFAGITANVGSTDTVTVPTWPVTPTGTVTYKIFGTAPVVGGGGGLDAAGVRAALGMSSANLDTQLAGIQSDTNDIQTRLPAALVSGRMDASVGAMAANVMTAAAAAADLTTELQAGLATAANLATVAGYLDTEIADIVTRTTDIQARLPATLSSGRIRAQVEGMNTDTMNAAALSADAIAEIQASVASASAVADIQSRLPPALVGGRMDASVGAMAANVVTAAALAPDAGAEIAATVGQRQIPDSYSSDGVQPTIEQAVLEIRQMLMETALSGNTLIIRKPDGSTAAFTLALTPDAASPTVRTRAT
jgi:hypothetical protein